MASCVLLRFAVVFVAIVPIDVSLVLPICKEQLMAVSYRGRRAAVLENNSLRVTVLNEGGHIAEIFDKTAGVNPLWTPPWPTIEPSAFDRADAAVYGPGSDASLLAGIMGHNLCLDIFGPPSDEEARAGLTPHGEGSIVPYDLTIIGEALVASARLPIAGLELQRRIVLRENALLIREIVTNVSDRDRAIGWTQHVTLGPPFLECGTTQFRASATRSKVFETTFGADDYLEPAAEFDWPMARGRDGTVTDLRVFSDTARSSAYTAHLMDQKQSTAYFVAFSPAFELAFGYVWKPSDFPWLGIWEENHSRLGPPWNGQTLTRGMEFGVSPMPETREAMIKRDTLFGVPCFRRVSAGESIEVEYCAVCQRTDVIPEWKGSDPFFGV